MSDKYCPRTCEYLSAPYRYPERCCMAAKEVIENGFYTVRVLEQDYKRHRYIRFKDCPQNIVISILKLVGAEKND